MVEQSPKHHTIDQIYQIVSGGDPTIENDLRRAESVLRRIAKDPDGSSAIELSHSPALRKEDLIVIFEELGDVTPVDAIKNAIDQEKEEIIVIPAELGKTSTTVADKYFPNWRDAKPLQEKKEKPVRKGTTKGVEVAQKRVPQEKASSESPTPFTDKYLSGWYEENLDQEVQEKRADATRKKKERTKTTPEKKPKETPLPPANFINRKDLEAQTGVGRTALGNILRYGTEKIKIARVDYFNKEQALSQIEEYKRKKALRSQEIHEKRSIPPSGFSDVAALHTMTGISKFILRNVLRSTENVRVEKSYYFNKEQALIQIETYKKQKAEREASAPLRKQLAMERKRVKIAEAGRLKRERLKRKPQAGFEDLIQLEALTGIGKVTLRKLLTSTTENEKIGNSYYFNKEQALIEVEAYWKKKAEQAADAPRRQTLVKERKKRRNAQWRSRRREKVPSGFADLKELEVLTGFTADRLNKSILKKTEKIRHGHKNYFNKDEALDDIEKWKQKNEQKRVSKKSTQQTFSSKSREIHIHKGNHRPEGKTITYLSELFGLKYIAVSKILRDTSCTKWGYTFYFDESEATKLIQEHLKTVPNHKRIYIRQEKEFVAYQYFKSEYGLGYYILDRELADVTRATEPGVGGIELVSLAEALSRLSKYIDIPKPDNETGIYTEDNEKWATRLVFKEQYGIRYEDFEKISDRLDVKLLRGKNGQVLAGYKLADVLREAQKLTHPTKWTRELIEEKSWELFLQNGELDSKVLRENNSLRCAINKRYEGKVDGLRKFLAEKAQQSRAE